MIWYQLATGIIAIAAGVYAYLFHTETKALKKKVARYEKYEDDAYEAKAAREEKLAERTVTLTVNSIEEVVAYAKKNRGKTRVYMDSPYDFRYEPELTTKVNVAVIVDQQDHTVTGQIQHVFPEYEFDRAKKNLIKDTLKKDLLG